MENQKELKKGLFPQYSEGSDFPGVRKVLEATDSLSRPSKIRTQASEENFIKDSNRPDALRRVRRKLAERIMPWTPKKERQASVREGRARDKIAEEFINAQREVRVSVGELGEQMARFVVLTPPEGRKTEETDLKPPIFLISGISNDLESMGMLPQEIAFKGRKVVLIGFPESWNGEVTDAFGKAAEESANYEPHTTFFKEAIKTIKENQEVKDRIGDVSKIDLWGYSAGAAIVAEMLTDQAFRGQIADAAIIAPPNCVDQKNLKIFGQEIPLPIAVIKELYQNLRPRNIKAAAGLNVINRHDIQYTEDHRNRMLRTYNALREKVLRKNNWWKNDLRVRDGGKITVISYESDHMTQSYKVADEIAQNPNLHLIKLPGSHNTPLTKPQDMIRALAA